VANHVVRILHSIAFQGFRFFFRAGFRNEVLAFREEKEGARGSALSESLLDGGGELAHVDLVRHSCRQAHSAELARLVLSELDDGGIHVQTRQVVAGSGPEVPPGCVPAQNRKEQGAQNKENESNNQLTINQ
jgi:hypothetical protein